MTLSILDLEHRSLSPAGAIVFLVPGPRKHPGSCTCASAENRHGCRTGDQNLSDRHAKQNRRGADQENPMLICVEGWKQSSNISTPLLGPFRWLGFGCQDSE
jgi:hypothetical protein